VSDDAELLRQARLRAGLSQRRLAERAGTSQAMVARIEGRRQSPSLPTLRRLLAACGSDIHLQVEGEMTAGEGAAAAAPPTARHLVLEMGDARLAVRLDAVLEVLPALPLRRLPAQPPHMAGVALVRGRPLACVELAGLIGLPPAQARATAVLETAAGPLGALVGAADRVLELDSQAVTPIPPGWSGCAAVTGLATADGQLLAVLDPGLLRIG
jgi:chemotaxis signal transduction protein/DNA-binding XRE family transcriptional regulator